MTALAALLREDVALEMPPLATWFSGRETVLGYVASNLGATAGRMRLVPAAANGQPAFAAYLRDADGAYRAHAMIVLTLTGALITRIVIFLEPALFRLFGLDRELAPGESGDRGWLPLRGRQKRRPWSRQEPKARLRFRQRLGRPGHPVVGGPQDHGAGAGLAAGDAVPGRGGAGVGEQRLGLGHRGLRPVPAAGRREFGEPVQGVGAASRVACNRRLPPRRSWSWGRRCRPARPRAWASRGRPSRSPRR